MKSNKELIEELKNNIAISNFERIDASDEINKGGRYVVKKIITIIITALAILAGSITVYAAMGGEIAGKPVIEWLGIKFSDEYENYKVDVVDQEVGANETKIELVSTVCDDGYTVLEFDVKLSKEDKEYLRIGEKVVTEADIEKALEFDREFNNSKDGEGPNYKSIIKCSDLENTIGLKLNSKDDRIINDCRNIILDDEDMWLRQSIQEVKKISDYEYKVYQLYFLTEKELADKTDFKLTFKDILIVNQAEILDYTANMYLANTPNNERALPVDGIIEANLSKKNVKNNIKLYYNNQEAKYKTMTQKIDEIKVTPLQVIIKLSLTTTNVSSISLGRVHDPKHIGHEDYQVYDEDGNKLNSHSFRKSQIITYEDGTQEEWGAYDNGATYDFENATIEITEYIVIEKADALKVLKIIPTISHDEYDENEQKIKKVIDELDEFNIELD